MKAQNQQDKVKIKELIVVEGKNDITAVKRAVDATVLITHGFGYNQKLIDTMKAAVNRQGVIIFTDPDYMGNRIRRELSQQVPGCKQASLAQSLASRDEDIGIENASPKDIQEALLKARGPVTDEETGRAYTMEDLRQRALVDHPDAAKRRQGLSEALHLGHCNGKQLLKRLNSFGISPEELDRHIEKIEDRNR